MVNFVKHFFNPLHIYCRLIDCGCPEKRARNICKRYDRIFFAIIVNREVNDDKRRSLRSLCERKTI